MVSDDKEILHKEIDLIQACIKRMANNSFLLKGWLLSLLAVILALISDKIELVSVFLIVPIIFFWYLDAYYLHLEKLYIKMYEW